MSEKAYKTMGWTGTLNIVLGIVLMVTGLASGVLLCVSGGRLLKNRHHITF